MALDDDDDFGADADFLSALASSASLPTSTSSQPPRPAATTAPRIQQPTPQRLDKPPPAGGTGAGTGAAKIVQPTPQALPTRGAGSGSGSSILVSPRQKGNPVLAALRAVAWEYSDIPADYALGPTTCALFLSLKYHRLHPEYVYTRIRNLQGRYSLRVLLALVDIPNHEDALRELAKTSLVNQVTLVLCWSAHEAARYLELYKAYEHASPAAIRGTQSASYAEKLVDFVTVPRGINKTDALSLVSAFASLRNAVNAEPEQVACIGGWGEKKVKRWCHVVEEPFRVQHAPPDKRRRLAAESASSVLDHALPLARVPLRDMPALSTHASRDNPSANTTSIPQPPDARMDDDDEAMLAAAIEASKQTAAAQSAQSASTPSSHARKEDELSDGIAAALARLRDKG